MSRMSRLIPALVTVVFLAAACSDTSNTPLAPQGPSYDEAGVGSTGGNRTDTTTTSTTTAPDSSTTAGGVGSTGGN